jgi:hypothetical protein
MFSKRIPDTALFVWIVLALTAYSLPWVINPSVSLSLGAYDLAEWSSLHPAARVTTPTLLTSLLLRLPLMLLAWIIGLNSTQQFKSVKGWGYGAAALLLSMSLLPPLEFFIQARDDANYQQQFVLTIGALAGAGLGLSGIVSAWRMPLLVITTILALGSSLSGMAQGFSLLNSFGLPVRVGLGGVAFIILCSTLMVYLIAGTVKINKATRLEAALPVIKA